MKKLYEKNELLLAIVWIAIYCMVSIPIRGSFGNESIVMLAGLSVISIGIWIFVKSLRLEEKYVYTGSEQIYAVISMMLVGFIKELIFRGFLFRALLKRYPAPVAVCISVVTFGIGHIVNLLAGQGDIETFIQVLFAVAWGFIFTFAFYKSGNLWICMIIHGLVDVSSTVAADSDLEYAYVIVTIIVSVVYCAYLSRKPAALSGD